MMSFVTPSDNRFSALQKPFYVCIPRCRAFFQYNWRSTDDTVDMFVVHELAVTFFTPYMTTGWVSENANTICVEADRAIHVFTTKKFLYITRILDTWISINVPCTSRVCLWGVCDTELQGARHQTVG